MSGQFISGISEKDGLTGKVAHAVLEDRSGAVWVATQSGVGRIADGQVRFFAPGRNPGDLPHSGLQALHQDRSGRIWLGGFNGLCSFQDGAFSPPIQYQSTTMPLLNVWAIREDRAGNLWLGTHYGLIRYRDRVEAVYTTQNGFAPRAGARSPRGSSGNVLAGHRRRVGPHGRRPLHHLHHAGWVGGQPGVEFPRRGRRRAVDRQFRRRPHPAQGWPLHRLHRSQWAGRQRRLPDPGRWRRQPVGQRLPRIVFRPEAAVERLLRRPDQRSHLPCPRPRRWHAELRLQRRPATFRIRDRNGRLWFTDHQRSCRRGSIPPDAERPPATGPHRGGADRQHPQPLSVPAPAPELRLLPGQANLEIRYTALSFQKTHLIRFRYRLESQDDGWVEAGNRRTANYAHLRPGSYRFQVIAANADGVWNQTGALPWP
jgi:hypothetical protein